MCDFGIRDLFMQKVDLNCYFRVEIKDYKIIFYLWLSIRGKFRGGGDRFVKWTVACSLYRYISFTVTSLPSACDIMHFSFVVFVNFPAIFSVASCRWIEMHS